MTTLQQGPGLMPRNWLADRLRGYGLNTLADRANSPTSGLGVVADGVGGVVNMLLQPVASFQEMLANPYQRGGTDERFVENAFDVAGGAMTGGLLSPKPRNSVGTFGGRLAKTADQEALARAEEMAGRGVPREQIWNETGWFQGVDGKWRFEIDDSGAKFNAPASWGQINDRPIISELFQHPEAFSSYPDRIPRLAPAEIGSGAYNSIDNEVMLNGVLPRGAYNNKKHFDRVAKAQNSTALHELQHWAQEAEGFARGGAPTEQTDAALAAYRRLAGEVEARAVQKRMDMTADQRRARPPWLDYDVPENQQIVRLYANGGRPGAAAGAAVNALAERQPRASVGMGGREKSPRPEPGALFPEAEATGASRVLAETRETVPVQSVARQVADQLGYEVYHSSGPVGYSSYLRTPLGDIRISDHPVGERRFLTEPPGYQHQQGVDAIVADLKARLALADRRAAERRERVEAAAVARREATAPVRAEQEANRQAKVDFWQRNGLMDATQTAKDKAWKAYRRGESDLYANGGRPGAAAGAVNSLLAGYGYQPPGLMPAPQQPDWTRNLRPGDI